jgi:hypothetical protein
MTESEWNSSADPQKMLEFLRGKASDRKLRLFALACCRRIIHLLADRRSRKVIEASERFADGLISAEKLRYVRGDARWAANVASRKAADSEGVKWIVAHLTEPDAQRVLAAIWPSSYLAGRETEQPVQCNLFRDIFGNPFKPVTINPAWLTSTVVSLAQAIYDERAFDRMPVLADALEESGCTSSEMLEHCRGGGEHVRGCWLLDLLLQKE